MATLIHKTPDLERVDEDTFKYMGDFICIQGIREFFDVPLNVQVISFEAHSQSSKYRLPFEVVSKSNTGFLYLHFDGRFVFDPCLDWELGEWEGKTIYIACNYGE